MTPPLVSVVIATHNRAELLLETLRSVLGQSHRNLEVIVVDDGSTDDTPTAVGTIDDSRLRYVYTRNWGGPARPRNVGLGLARGEYVAFCDDDDLWLPEKVERQLEVIAGRTDVALVYVLYATMPPTEEGEPLPAIRWRIRGYGAFRPLYLGISIPHSGVLARTAALRALGGFDERRSLISCEDSDLWLRVARQHAIDFVPDDVLLRYRVHATGISRRQLSRTWRATMALQAKHRHEAGLPLYLLSVLRYSAFFVRQWFRSPAPVAP